MAGTISSLVTWIVFGFWGFEISKKYNRKIKYKTIIFYFVLSIILSFIGVGTSIVSFFGFAIMLNNLLSSLAAGYALGLLINFWKVNHAAKY